MVLELGPGKFYGSSLPRPRFYTNVRFNSERVDPPVSVMDPLISWADENHWNMGGTSFTRHRLQGCIEGSVQKLRTQEEKSEKEMTPISPEKIELDDHSTPSPPPAPRAVKRRRRLIDEEEEVEGVDLKRTTRKLKDDFDKVSTPVKMVTGVAEEVGMATRTSSRRSDVENEVQSKRRKLVKRGEKVGSTVVVNKTRTSPRLR